MFLLSKLRDILYYEIIRKKQDVKAEFFSSNSYIKGHVNPKNVHFLFT